MNRLDLDYQFLLNDILANGTKKQTRNGETISVFGRQLRHQMSTGFPLLTTKKMYFKGIVTELLWFLRGDTNIKFLIDNDCHIWDGDCYQAYIKRYNKGEYVGKTKLLENSKKNRTLTEPFAKEEFINKIKTDDAFAKKWGELGKVYGAQWRSWRVGKGIETTLKNVYGETIHEAGSIYIDQIQKSINLLKTDPDSRRNRVSAWNVGELSEMTLPPCHTDFQFYTRILSDKERYDIWFNNHYETGMEHNYNNLPNFDNPNYIPTPVRAISIMVNMRSVDVPLGLPFNIASYALLLEIIGKMVNMVPEELIMNLGDCHIYSNQVQGIQEQLSRSSYQLPSLQINTEFWPTISGECGIGLIDANAVLNSLIHDEFCKSLMTSDIQLNNYQSHPSIKMPLSN